MQVTIEIPTEVITGALFEDAASTHGWTALVDDGEGGLKANPVSAIEWCMNEIFVAYLVKFAGEARANRQITEVRRVEQERVRDVGERWKEANKTIKPKVR